MIRHRGAVVALILGLIFSAPQARADEGKALRSDVATWLSRQEVTPPQRAALEQLAQSFQEILTIKLSDESALLRAARNQSAAIKCVVRRRVSLFGGKNMVSALRNLTMNTPERFKYYAKYSEALNGRTFKSPKGDGCNPSS